MIKKIVFISFVLLCFSKGFAQSLRHKTLSADRDTFMLDSLPVLPESLAIFNNGTLLTSGYQLSGANKILIIDTSQVKGKLNVYYRVLMLNYKPVYSHKSPSLIEPEFNAQPRNYYNYTQNESNNLLFSNSGLNVNGNIARGLGFGNTQDVVVNSNLNLQMSGKLGKGVSILAAISDENNPIQPEGNTQQIQDFDKVFITLQKDSSSLTVGDVLMSSSKENYFMKYYKKSRGLQLDHRTGAKNQYHAHLDGAVSRGRFVRNEIQGSEGNQGPYRLQGANNEFNIIVISGTEVVYVDGEKLSRGQQNEYIIDYNTGEVTFMPKKLITKFSRIIVEFQYSDRNYARSVFVAGNEFKSGKWVHSLQYFREQDNKQQPTDTSNKGSIQDILENAGDQQATYQNIRQYLTFQSDRVMYRKKDSANQTIFVHVTSANEADTFYTVSFSYAGNGKGDYVSIASASNGRVFAWVAPVNGLPSGNYVPYIEVVAPNSMQMLTGSSRWSVNEKTSLKLEGVYTNYDKNTLSTLDKFNDDGFGAYIDFNQKDLKAGQFGFTNEVKVEMVSKYFKSVERYRNVEFDRIWNRQLSNTGSKRPELNEIITNLKTTISFKDLVKLQLMASNYKKGNQFDGLRGASDLSITKGPLQVNASGEYISTASNQLGYKATGEYYRYKGGAIYTAKYIKLGADALREDSRFKVDTTNKLDRTSFAFNQFSGFIQNMNTIHWKYRLDGNMRTDFLPDSNVLMRSSVAYNATGTAEQTDAKGNRLLFTVNYRKLETLNQTVPDETILNRIEYNAGLFKKAITTSTYYQIGTGREQKRQFSYTLVQPGLGTHTWVDYNGNGREELNEFEIAVYRDQAKYVKVYFATNEFIKSNTNEFNQSIRLQAPQSWGNRKGFKKALTRFNTITSYKADRRMTDNRLEAVFNPFFLNVADTSLIAVSSLIKQTTFYNRSSAKFGLEHTIQTNRSKSTLNSGFEWRKINKQNLIARYGFNKNVNLVSAFDWVDKQNTNQFFTGSNYHYISRSVFPELFYQNVKGYRMGLFYKYLEAANAKDLGAEEAYITEVGAEFRYFIINKGNIDAKLTSHTINFRGNTNSPMAFDLMNGLSNGKNLTWVVGFGGKAAGNIQINISYEGRKAGENKPIHIGRAEARYIF